MDTLTKVRKDGFDKFYTNPSIVDKCFATLNKLFETKEFDFIIEPSAGSGNFYKKIQHADKIAMDIHPEHKNIIKKDYFTYYPDEKYKKILIIGNPPFGKVSSLAIQFFNHSSTFADVIAFILPRTFRKISVQNKLNTQFHLEFDEDVPLTPCSFTPKMNVKCCFQIWKKKEIKREIIHLPTVHQDWKFLRFGPKDENGQPTPPKNADFALKAYGGKCGVIECKMENLRPKSWHWIKANIDVDELTSNFEKLNYKNSVNTARQNSIGKAELIQLYDEFKNRKKKINKSDLVEKCSVNNNLSSYPDKDITDSFNVNIGNEINKTTNQIIKLPNTRFQGSKKKI